MNRLLSAAVLFSRFWFIFIILVAPLGYVAASDLPVLVQVRRDPPVSPGQGDRIYLIDPRGQLLRTIDLPRGAAYVQHDETEVVFQLAGGGFARLVSPFRGALQRIDQPRGRESTPFTHEQGAALLLAAASMTDGLVRAIPQVAAEVEAARNAPTSPEPSNPSASRESLRDERVSSKQAAMVYSVVVSGDRLICINAVDGSQQGAFSPAGTIAGSPVVAGDLCTVKIATPTGMQAYTMRLPSFSIVNIINVN